MRLIATLALLAWVSPLAAAQPNILFILADDLGWRDLGCYGSPFNETPNIDKLASQGLRFTQAYTAGAVCSPTRGSIMSGKFPVRTGVTDYIPGLSSAGRKLVTKPTNKQLALEEVTVAEALREGGYQTFYAGKWHLGNQGFEPQDQGFEVVVSDADLGNHGRDWQAGQRLSESAVKFLDERDAKRPFFMFLGYHEPHTPILEYPAHIAKYKEKAAGQITAAVHSRQERDGQTRLLQNDPAYASEVAGLDSFVGSVLEKVDKSGLADNTIVIFFSDNGGLSTKADIGPTSNEPLRAGKGWLYEGGIRVPLIVRAPGKTKAGATAETPVISTDVYPTLLSLAGLPVRPQQHRDGLDVSGVLGGGAAPMRDTLFWHYPHYHGSTWAPGGAMREGDWKLIELFDEGTAELYNLKDDLSERENLAAAEPERLKAMREKLAAWRAETGAYVPVPGETPVTEKPQAKKNKKKKSAE